MFLKVAPFLTQQLKSYKVMFWIQMKQSTEFVALCQLRGAHGMKCKKKVSKHSFANINDNGKITLFKWFSYFN